MLSHHFLLGVGNWVEIMSLLSSLIFQLKLLRKLYLRIHGRKPVCTHLHLT